MTTKTSKPKRKSPVKPDRVASVAEQVARILRPLRASDFQLSHFVLNMNGVTPFGVLKQALRELEVRRAAVDAYAKEEKEGEPEKLMALIHEMRFFTEKANALIEKLGGVSALQDAEYVEALELDFQACRLYREAALDRCATGQIARGTLEAISALPCPANQQVLSALVIAFSGECSLMDVPGKLVPPEDAIKLLPR